MGEMGVARPMSTNQGAARELTISGSYRFFGTVEWENTRVWLRFATPVDHNVGTSASRTWLLRPLVDPWSVYIAVSSSYFILRGWLAIL